MKYFYNRNGEPICYIEDNVHIFSFSGDPLGYLYDDKIYAYSGNLLGWYIDDWMVDLNGRSAFYTETSRGGLVKPTMKVAPIRSVKRITPIKCTRRVPSIRPIKQLSWSYYSDLDFFR